MRPPLALALVLLAGPASAETITGRASVIDGDTLDIRGTRFRLQGVDTPESAQMCGDAQGKDYPCGRRAAFALSDKIGQGNVACEVIDRDRYGRSVAVCRLGAEDLNGWLVAQGWGMAYRQYSTAYVPLEDEAKAAHRRDLAGTVHPTLGLAEGQAGREHERRAIGPRREASDRLCLGLPDQGQHQPQGRPDLPRARLAGLRPHRD